MLVRGRTHPARERHAERDTCARLASGAVLCSGEVYYARPVAGIEDAAEIDVGSHACARLADGTFRCWGYNADGQAMAGGCCHDSLCGIPDGASCGRDGGTCEGLWCSACGDEGEPCCDRARVGGRRCREERSLCDGRETCVACGVLGDPCCEGESPCDGEGAVCFRGVCAQPGRPGAPCAEGGACDAAGCCVLEGHGDHVCVSVGSECTVPEGATARLCGAGGSCSGCGGNGEPCCASASSRIESYCSAPGLACNAESDCSVE